MDRLASMVPYKEVSITAHMTTNPAQETNHKLVDNLKGKFHSGYKVHVWYMCIEL